MHSFLRFLSAKPARRPVVWLLCLLLGWSGLTQAQTVRYVRPTGSGSGNGSSWANASGNLQAIINASNAGDQIWVAGGTYKPGGNTNTDRAVSFSMKNAVIIYGGFVGTETALSQRPVINPVGGQPSSTTLSGDIGTPNDNRDNSYHVIHNRSGLSAVTLMDGFVVTAGNANAPSELGDGTNYYGGAFSMTGVGPVTSVTPQFAILPLPPILPEVMEEGLTTTDTMVAVRRSS